MTAQCSAEFLRQAIERNYYKQAFKAMNQKRLGEKNEGNNRLAAEANRSRLRWLSMDTRRTTYQLEQSWRHVI